jgi:hypothetical protein
MAEVFEFFHKLFGAESWPARWHCGRWTDFHGWLYICSDVAIWAAYFIIPVFLIKLLRQRPDIPFPKVFILFGAFILLCGLTHLVDATMFWWPAYRLNAFVRFLTACVSWGTIVALAKIFPQALALKTASEFEAEIAERKKIELILQERTKELERKNAETEQFAYVASHDLQSPLRNIANVSNLLETEYGSVLDETGHEYLGYLSAATKRMQNIITDLLEYSRVGNNKTRTVVNCEQALQEVIKDLSIIVKESNTQIVIESLPVITCYETELKLLFQNLITNSIKYRKKDSNLIIKIYAEDEYNQWKFAVKDNGIGIDKKYHEKIFIIFQKLHSQEEYPGTGIGLAHCKKIAEQHGGKIWVESALGEGSTFYFTIPKAIVS